jgi:hypothetical protein
MCLRAELNISDGNFSKAIDDITDCYAMGGHFIDGQKFLGEQLKGMRTQSAALRSIFVILNKQSLDKVFLVKIQNAFEELTSKYNSFNLEGEKDYLQAKIKKDPAYYDYGQYLKGALEYYDLVVQKNPWQLKNDKTAEKLVADNMLVQDVPGTAAAAQVYHQNNATMKAVITTIAALRYKTDTGKIPQNLNELITAGYLKALPMDPYSNQSLVYKPVGSDFKLYSVGADFDDDGGKHHRFWGGDSIGGDYVFWPVQYPKDKERVQYEAPARKLNSVY